MKKKASLLGFLLTVESLFFGKTFVLGWLNQLLAWRCLCFFFWGHPPENEKAHPAVHGKKTENPPLKRAGDCSLPEGYRSLRLWMCKKCRQWRTPAKELLTYWEVLRRPLSLEMCGDGVGDLRGNTARKIQDRYSWTFLKPWKEAFLYISTVFCWLKLPNSENIPMSSTLRLDASWTESHSIDPGQMILLVAAFTVGWHLSLGYTWVFWWLEQTWLPLLKPT